MKFRLFLQNIIQISLLLQLVKNSNLFDKLYKSSTKNERDICNGSDGCIFAIKNLIYVPLLDQYGNIDKLSEDFNYKIMLVYEDRLIFYNTDQGQIFQRQEKPGDLLRTVSYSQVSLDCGYNGNKLCTLQQFVKVNPKFSPHQALKKKLGSSSDIYHQCFVIPIIDSTERPIEESLIYICSQNDNLIRDHYNMKQKISRYIDKFQIYLMADSENAMNGIPRKLGQFEFFSQSSMKREKIQTILHFQQLLGQQMNNNNKELFNLQLNNIQSYPGVMTIDQAIQNNTMSESEWKQIQQDQGFYEYDKKCCIIIQQKDQIEKIIGCVDKSMPSNCEALAQSWTIQLNAFIQRIQYIEDYSTLLAHGSQIDCQNLKEMQIIKQRIVNVEKYQNEICKEIAIYSPNFKEEHCTKDRTDEITQEVRQLSKNNRNLSNAFENCIKLGLIPVSANALA